MDDVLRVRRNQGVGDLDSHIQDFLDLHGVAGYVLLQALALQPLHHYERMAVIVLDTVNGADVGMVQQRSGPGLAGKSLERLGIAGKVLWNELQGDVAPKFEVLGLINHAHTPAPQFAKDAVMRYLLTNHERARGSAVMLGPQSHPVNWLMGLGLGHK